MQEAYLAKCSPNIKIAVFTRIEPPSALRCAEMKGGLGRMYVAHLAENGRHTMLSRLIEMRFCSDPSCGIRVGSVKKNRNKTSIGYTSKSFSHTNPNETGQAFIRQIFVRFL